MSEGKGNQQVKVEVKVQTASSTSSITSDPEVIPTITDDGLAFTSGLHISVASEENLIQKYDMIKYKESDQKTVLKQLSSLNLDKLLLIQIIIVCALIGPSRSSSAILLNSRTSSGINTSASRSKSKSIMICNRTSAATVDLTIFFIKKLNDPKRFNTSSPAWFHFPSVASVRMNEELRSSIR